MIIKKIRKAVRTYLIRDNKVVVIRYKDHATGYYDIPGGKIEDKETSLETSVREFMEETGMKILKQHYIGHNTTEYPDRIYDFDVFIVDDYIGEPQEFDENTSMWIDIDELFKEEKLFSSIKAIKYLKDNMNLKIECDSNNNILRIEDIKND